MIEIPITLLKILLYLSVIGIFSIIVTVIKIIVEQVEAHRERKARKLLDDLKNGKYKQFDTTKLTRWRSTDGNKTWHPIIRE